MSLKKSFLQLTIAVVFLTSVLPLDAMERRRQQFIKEHGHYVAPAPYSYPGIGEGIVLLGVYANAHDSYTDYAGFIIGGDVEGFGAVVTDVHLVERNLIAEAAIQKLNKVAVYNYNGRGMNSDKNDFNILDIDNVESKVARLRGTSANRMFEVMGMAVQSKYHLAGLRDKEGNLIIDTSNSETREVQHYTASLQLDWTDDFQDPRVGVRYNLSRWWRDETSAYSSEYYQQEHNITAYVPVGRISTWAFNFFRSDAVVTRPGDTNFSSVEERMGLDCSKPGLTAEQQRQCLQTVNNTIAHNRYGTAASMGGTSRLRSYPNGRFSGAHTLFYGTELRWNVTEEFQPFDIGIARDIRTGMQLSLFWETASVADEKDKLGETWKDSYGFGIRFIMTSGFVFRAEVANGDEGENIVMFFNYPWSDY